MAVPSFPRRRESKTPSRLREGTRKRSDARGRRSVRPQLPPATPTLPPSCAPTSHCFGVSSFPRRRESRTPSRLREGTRKRSEARGRRSVRPQLPPATPTLPPSRAPTSHCFGVPSFPRRRESRTPSRLREGTRKRSEARGRRSVRPQLPPATPTLPPSRAPTSHCFGVSSFPRRWESRVRGQRTRRGERLRYGYAKV